LFMVSALCLLVTALALVSCATSSCVPATLPEHAFCSHLGTISFYTARNLTALSLDVAEVETIDRGAMTAFYAGNGLTYPPCCREVFKRWVCAEHFPQCVDGVRSQLCRSFICNAAVGRTDVEKQIDGFMPTSCLLQPEDPFCFAQVRPDNEDYPCTCPKDNSITTNKDCMPYNLTMYIDHTLEAKVCSDDIMLSSGAILKLGPAALMFWACAALFLL